MQFEDSGRCSFFYFVHELFVTLSQISGIEIEYAKCRDGVEHLRASRVVRVKFELTRGGVRIYAKDFGAFSRIDNTLPYDSILKSYVNFRDAAQDVLTSIQKEVLCRACEVMINAIERKAPGLYFELLESGLPKGFKFETWGKGVEHTIPGQILRHLPRHLPEGDIQAIVGWAKGDAFAAVVQRIFRDLDARYDGMELRN